MRILVGFDGSPDAQQAVTTAAALATATGGRLTVVLVAESSQLTINAPLTSHEWDRQALNPDARIETPDPEASRHLLDQARAIAKGCGSDAETQRRVGEPAAQLTAAAADLEADLIVVGSHGRTGLDRWLMGSVAESVLRQASRPVLIVKGRPALTCRRPESPAA